MTEPLLRLVDLRKRYGALAVTDGVSLDVRAGEIHALIGPNGAGKTTLVGQIAGLLKPDSGQVLLLGQDITALDAPARARLGLGRSFQITSVFASMSALENVALAVRARAGHGFHFWQAASSDARAQTRARQILDMTGVGHLADAPAAQLAHGELRQLELAMALAVEPRLLVLDEPMAGLGAGESRQMVDLLAQLKTRYGMLLIEHDMDAVFALADRVSVLVAGRVVCTGSPAEIRDSDLVRQAYLGDSDA
jgi:branched-chain amino acid transport system ATP-binding protein